MCRCLLLYLSLLWWIHHLLNFNEVFHGTCASGSVNVITNVRISLIDTIELHQVYLSSAVALLHFIGDEMIQAECSWHWDSIDSISRAVSKCSCIPPDGYRLRLLQLFYGLYRSYTQIHSTRPCFWLPVNDLVGPYSGFPINITMAATVIP
jgi:hypothetical protein